MTDHARERTIRASVASKAVAALLSAGDRGLNTDELCHAAGSHAAPRRLWDVRHEWAIRKVKVGPDRWRWFCDGRRIASEPVQPRLQLGV